MQLNIHVYAIQVKNRQHYQNEKRGDVISVKLGTMLLGDLSDSTPLLVAYTKYGCR